MKELYTYRDLLEYLRAIPHSQLDQPIQIAQSTGSMNDPVELKPAIAIGTVAEMEFPAARSIIDNQYHGEDVVLLIDANPFAPDGAVAYQLSDGKLDIPIYGKGGPTPPELQRAPEYPGEIGDIHSHSRASIRYRLGNHSRLHRPSGPGQGDD